ncbi:hypothetical protein GFGA_1d0556 [Gluconobacter frateurii NBRC 103465]|nr:hypothetical protein GFGA_1d0556 [Gluconobacter frateurii NBRC 103465]
MFQGLGSNIFCEKYALSAFPCRMWLPLAVGMVQFARRHAHSSDISRHDPGRTDLSFCLRTDRTIAASAGRA